MEESVVRRGANQKSYREPLYKYRINKILTKGFEFSFKPTDPRQAFTNIVTDVAVSIEPGHNVHIACPLPLMTSHSGKCPWDLEEF